MIIIDCNELPSSKSLANRALICKAFQPELDIKWNCPSKDIQDLDRCISEFLNQETSFDCGSGGTNFRFFSIMLSRFPGEYELHIDSQLESRPQEDLIDALKQTKCKLKWKTGKLYLDTRSASWPHSMNLKLKKTSQILSAVLLSSWNLNTHLSIGLSKEQVSPSYYHMTLNLLKDLGLHFSIQDLEIKIPKQQNFAPICYNIEPDLSALFAIIALGINKNCFIYKNWPQKSLQPDFFAHKILRNMGIQFKTHDDITKLDIASELKPITVNLNSTPDLFPVLSILCSFVPGESYLFGAKHLAFKESNRLETTANLLKNMGKDFQLLEDGIKIFGSSSVNNSAFNYSSEKDHRQIMAAEVANSFGANINVLDPEAVNKSFPSFYQYVKEAK